MDVKTMHCKVHPLAQVFDGNIVPHSRSTPQPLTLIDGTWDSPSSSYHIFIITDSRTSRTPHWIYTPIDLTNYQSPMLVFTRSTPINHPKTPPRHNPPYIRLVDRLPVHVSRVYPVRPLECFVSRGSSARVCHPLPFPWLVCVCHYLRKL